MKDVLVGLFVLQVLSATVHSKVPELIVEDEDGRTALPQGASRSGSTTFKHHREVHPLVLRSGFEKLSVTTVDMP